MASQAEDELAPSQTDGFKVSEKKTIDEYTKLGEQSASVVVNPFSGSKTCCGLVLLDYNPYMVTLCSSAFTSFGGRPFSNNLALEVAAA